MAILKCKMCGGNLEVTETDSVCECEYCGSRQTVPKIDNEKKVTLFSRANRLRLDCEFDKATGIYESIITEFPDEAESYWGLVLCKYGIEYVDDPLTAKKIPTCHRSSFNSVLEDPDYQMALQKANISAKIVYEMQAAEIEKLRSDILAVSSREEPYDIFICYKETAEDGQRTEDSVIAQDVYDALTEKGYRVFFSRITLEDRLGQEYEPFIFAALNSAKIMLAFGTKEEYYQAVWVKNEWSRYLGLMAQGAKKTLIPCYKYIDAYDIPAEFRRLQAQDMGKVGAIQDLIRGIEKILGAAKPQVVQQVVYSGQGTSHMEDALNLVKRGNMALEDGQWKEAQEFFEHALDKAPECAEAYVGEWMIENRVKSLDQMARQYEQKFKVEDGEIARACEKDTEYIAQMIENFAVPGYLEEEEIEDLYDFDLSFQVDSEARKEQKNKTVEDISRNRYFARASQYAQGETKAQLENFTKGIQSYFDDLIRKASEAKDENRDRIISEYRVHTAQADETVKALNRDAQIERENDYQSITAKFQTVPGLKECQEMRKKLLAMKGYRDSAAYVTRCNVTEVNLTRADRSNHVALECENAANEYNNTIAQGVQAVEKAKDEVYQKGKNAAKHDALRAYGAFKAVEGYSNADSLAAKYRREYKGGNFYMLFMVIGYSAEIAAAMLNLIELNPYYQQFEIAILVFYGLYFLKSLLLRTSGKLASLIGIILQLVLSVAVSLDFIDLLDDLLGALGI